MPLVKMLYYDSQQPSLDPLNIPPTEEFLTYVQGGDLTLQQARDALGTAVVYLSQMQDAIKQLDKKDKKIKKLERALYKIMLSYRKGIPEIFYMADIEAVQAVAEILPIKFVKDLAEDMLKLYKGKHYG